MDGVRIITSSIIDDEEELFNVLHMIGHSIQWNTDVEKEKTSEGSIMDLAREIFHSHPNDVTSYKVAVQAGYDLGIATSTKKWSDKDLRAAMMYGGF